MVRPIHRFAPLQPSNLRFLSGPSSPQSPISPITSHPRFFPSQITRSLSSPSSTSSGDTEMTDPPPMEPMPWVWCCHLCSSHFPLGATRRCLHDGHHFCGGTTYNKKTGRVRRHRSCQSEFDYRSWVQWGNWRREQSHDLPAIPGHKDCGTHCDFPSECRFAKKRVVANRSLERTITQSNGYASSETLAATAAISPSAEPVSAAVVSVAATPDQDPAASLLFPTAPKPLPPPPSAMAPVLRRSGYTIERLVKESGRKPAHKPNTLSPIQEEHSSRSSLTSTTNPGLSFPALKFTSFHTGVKKFQTSSFLEEEHELIDPVKALDALSQEVMNFFDYEADIDTDGTPVSPDSGSGSDSHAPPETSTPPSPAMDVPPILSLQNYLNFQKGGGGRRDRLDEVSAISWRMNALPGGSIGGALTPPSTPKGVRRNRGYESGDEMKI